MANFAEPEFSAIDEKYEYCVFPQMAERDNENNVEQLSTSVDFLLELCDTISPHNVCSFN